MVIYYIARFFILLLFLVWRAERCAKTVVLIVLIVTGSIAQGDSPHDSFIVFYFILIKHIVGSIK